MTTKPTRFDVEAQIHACWNVVEDIDILLEGVCDKEMTPDQIANALLGMKEIYALRFDKLFRTFEKTIPSMDAATGG